MVMIWVIKWEMRIIKLKSNLTTFKLNKCSEKIKLISVSLPSKNFIKYPQKNNSKTGKLKSSISSFKSIAKLTTLLKFNKLFKESLNLIKNKSILKTPLNPSSWLSNLYHSKVLTKISNLCMDSSLNWIILEKLDLIYSFYKKLFNKIQMLKPKN